MKDAEVPANPILKYIVITSLTCLYIPYWIVTNSITAAIYVSQSAYALLWRNRFIEWVKERFETLITLSKSILKNWK